MLIYDPSPEALLQPELHEPLFHEGRNYTLTQLAAECARLAYLHYEVDATEFTILKIAMSRVGYGVQPNSLQCFIAPETGTQAFAAHNAETNQVIVAFRGTQSDSPKDWITDAKFLPRTLRGNLKVHAGFDDAWLSMAGMLRHWLAVPLTHGAKLCLCGHSLGAAIATRAALELPCDTLITLGSPRVGNSAFAAELMHSVREVHRFVNCCDVVPLVPLPPVYLHAGTSRYIDRHGICVEGEVNEIAQEADRSRAKAEWIIGSPTAPPGKGRVMLRDLADHSPINYLRALF